MLTENYKRRLQELAGLISEDFRKITLTPDYEPVRTLLDSLVVKLKNYINDFIMSNNDMYKYYYKIGSSELKKVLELDNDEKFSRVLVGIEDVHPNELQSVLNYVIWSVDDLLYKEIRRIKEENQQQWNS